MYTHEEIANFLADVCSSDSEEHIVKETGRFLIKNPSPDAGDEELDELARESVLIKSILSTNSTSSHERRIGFLLGLFLGLFTCNIETLKCLSQIDKKVDEIQKACET